MRTYLDTVESTRDLAKNKRDYRRKITFIKALKYDPFDFDTVDSDIEINGKTYDFVLNGEVIKTYIKFVDNFDEMRDYEDIDGCALLVVYEDRVRVVSNTLGLLDVMYNLSENKDVLKIFYNDVDGSRALVKLKDNAVKDIKIMKRVIKEIESKNISDDLASVLGIESASKVNEMLRNGKLGFMSSTVGADGADLETAKKDLEIAGKDLEAAKEKIRSLDKQLEESFDKINDLEAAIRKLQIENSRIADLETEIEVKKSEINELKRTISDIEIHNAYSENRGSGEDLFEEDNISEDVGAAVKVKPGENVRADFFKKTEETSVEKDPFEDDSEADPFEDSTDFFSKPSKKEEFDDPFA